MKPASSSVISRRVSNACQRCRRRKIRCSGTHPCSNCSRRNFDCEFDGEGRRVVVSRKYLQELQRAAARPGDASEGNRAPQAREGTAEQPMPVEDAPFELQTAPASLPTPDSTGEPSNPLASSKSSYVSDDNGRLRWLGESSTWSFSRKTLLLFREHLQESDLPNIAINEESRAYDLNWGDSPLDGTAKFKGLPSLDHAVYLIESLKFHVGQLFHLFDEKTFMHRINEFYQDPVHYANANRIWYVQFLAVLALAKAVAMNPAKRSRTLPGSDLFGRAMSLMPDSSYLFNDALTAIETLCVIALYLQSADMRNSAYIYTSQAMGMSLVFGLHRERPTDDVWNSETAIRCHKVWWTVYILERNFACTMGVPMTIQEEDITTPMPEKGADQKSTSLYVHVRISGLIFQVIRKIYGVEGRLQANFLPNVKTVLSRIASIAGDLNGCYPVPAEGSEEMVSRVSAHLHLVYHQAILLTMYPLLLYLVQTRLREGTSGSRESRSLSETTKALLKSCAESCNTMIRILSLLRKEGLLESFLPFDLERIFSAAFVLRMLRFVTPRLRNYRALRSESILLLDDLINRGSIPASFRKSELESLETMINIWREEESRHVLDQAITTDADQPIMFAPDSETPISDVLGLGVDDLEGNAEDPITMSPGHLLSLVEMVDYQEGDMDTDMTWMNTWLWENVEVLPST